MSEMMQYAVWQMPHKEKKLDVLVDASELPILDHGEEGVSNFKTPENDDHLALKVVYGVLKSNNLRGLLDLKEMQKVIDDHKNKWLVHLKPSEDESKPLEAVYLGFEDMTIFPCGHLRQGDFAFAALMGLPDGLKFHSEQVWGVTSFLRVHDLDLVTNLINREIVITLIEEELSINSDLTLDNWKDFVNEGVSRTLARKVN